MPSASTSASASKSSKSAKSSKSSKLTTDPTSTSSKPAKSSSKSKAKSKATVTETSDDVPVEARNEGVEPTWEYKPPAKFASVHDAKGLEFEFGDFDWDSVKKDKDVEVWLVRVPESVKPKHLKGVHLTLPKHSTTTTTTTPAKSSPSSSSSSSLDSSSDSDSSTKPAKSKSKTSQNTSSTSNAESGPIKIGSLDRKERTYDIWSLPAVSPREANAQNKRRDADEDGEDGEDKGGAATIEGEELRTLNVLLPKAKKGGKLYLALKPIARHIVFSAPPALPVSTPKTEASPAALYQNPPRHAYPPELLKHRFRPYGVRGHAEGESVGNIAAMDVDREVGEEKEGAEKAGKEKEKGKKRKAETSPKKSKKVKTQ